MLVQRVTFRVSFARRTCYNDFVKEQFQSNLNTHIAHPQHVLLFTIPGLVWSRLPLLLNTIWKRKLFHFLIIASTWRNSSSHRAAWSGWIRPEKQDRNNNNHNQHICRVWLGSTWTCVRHLHILKAFIQCRIFWREYRRKRRHSRWQDFVVSFEYNIEHKNTRM